MFRSVGFLVVMLALTGSILYSTAHGVSYQIGLKEGDSALFSVRGPFFANVTETEMLVLSVVGSEITANFTDTYLDGSQLADTFFLNIETGQRNSTVEGGRSFIFAVGTNLSPGDRLYNNSPSTISRQEMFECGGQSRETVFSSYNDGPLSIRSHWDRSTGVLCQFILDDPDPDSPGAEDLTLSMMQTSLWRAESLFLRDLLFVAPFILAAVVLIGAFLLLRRRRKGEKT